MRGGRHETQKENRLDVQSGTYASGDKDHTCDCSGICDGWICAGRKLDAVFHGDEVGGKETGTE